MTFSNKTIDSNMIGELGFEQSLKGIDISDLL